MSIAATIEQIRGQLSLDTFIRGLTEPDAPALRAELQEARKAAAALFPTADPADRAELLALAARAALLAATLIDRLETDEDTGELRVSPERTCDDRVEQARLLSAAAGAVNDASARGFLINEGRAAIERVPEESGWRGDLYIELARVAADPERADLARKAVAAFHRAAGADPPWGLAAAAPHLPLDEGAAALRALLQHVRADPEQLTSLGTLLPGLPAPLAAAHWPDALAVPLPEAHGILSALAAAMATTEAVSAAFDRVIAVLKAGADDHQAHASLRRLAPHLDSHRVETALFLADRLLVNEPDARAALAVRLAELGDIDRALAMNLDIERTARIKAAIAARIPARRALLDDLARDIALLDPLDRFGCLFELGEALSAAGVTDSILALAGDFAPGARLTALVLFAKHDPRRAPALTTEAMMICRAIGAEDPSRLTALLDLVEHLTPPDQTELYFHLLDAGAELTRHELLSGDGIHLAAMLPLIAALAGDTAVLAVARQVTDIAHIP